MKISALAEEPTIQGYIVDLRNRLPLAMYIMSDIYLVSRRSIVQGFLDFYAFIKKLSMVFVAYD